MPVMKPLETPSTAAVPNHLDPAADEPLRGLPRSKTDTGQAAGKGVLKIVGFFLLLGLLAAVLNAAINFGLKRIKVSKFGALNRIMTGQVNADIIISGSSRALSHYDPRVIQSRTGRTAYNIGMNASQIDFELAILKTYLAHNAKPSLVIQNLDLFSFETTKQGELYDPGYYLPYWSDPNLYAFVRRKLPDAWRCKYIPLYGYAVEDMRFTWIWGILGCLGIQGREDYYQGFNPRGATWNNDFEHFHTGNAAGVQFAVEPEGVQCLESLIELCQQRGIQVILVYSPEYIEMQALETNREEIMGKFHEIAVHFNVPFWNYSDSVISTRRSNFNNSQHLNVDGAEIFSTDLARRLAESMPQWNLQRTADIPTTNRPTARVVQE